MSRKAKKNAADQAAEHASRAAGHAKQAVAQLGPVADRVKPLARSTGAAAKRGVRRTRAWAAPQVERAGQVLQDDVVPKVSAMLTSAAQRLDPAEPQRRSWRKPLGVALAAAASLTAAVARKRVRPGSQAPAEAEREPVTTASAAGGQTS